MIDANSVDEKMIALAQDFFHSPPHGQPRGFQNVDPVDFERVRSPHSPGAGTLANSAGQHFPPLRIERFAVVEAANGALGIENHRSREYRTE